MIKKLLVSIILIISYQAVGQSIKSISPSNASQVESIVMSIVCEDIMLTSGTYGVKLVDPTNSASFLNATTVTVVNDTMVNASFTFNSTIKIGSYDVVIYDPPTKIIAALKTSAFNLNSPINSIPAVILSIAPTEATQGDTMDIIIKTKNTFFSQPGPTGLWLQSSNHTISPISQIAINNETIKAKFAFNYSDSAGIYDAVISNPISGFLHLNQIFTIRAGLFPPELISIAPNSCTRFDSVKVTIKGKNTSFIKDSSAVNLISSNAFMVPASTIEYVSDTELTASFNFTHENASPAGLYTLVVSGRIKGGTLSLPNSFRLNDAILQPSIISFNPVKGKQGDSLKITVKGKNTHFLNNYNYVVFENNKGALGGQSKVLNDSTIEGSIYLEYRYATAPSKFAVKVGGLDGLLVATDSFLLEKGNNPPKVISIDPNNIVQGKKIDLLIKGSKNTFPGPYFLNPQLTRNNAASYFAKSYSVINDSMMIASFEFPTDTTKLGLYDFSTSDPVFPNTSLVLASSFTVNKNPAPPNLISISPSTATQFDTVLLTVNASHAHFLAGPVGIYMPASNANNGDAIFVNSVNPINDTTLQVKFVLLANYYAYTLYDLRVYDAMDGAMEIKKAFTVKQIYMQQPAIIDIDPKEALRGQTITMNIRGVTKSFKPGNISARLFIYNGSAVVDYIYATSVNFINDSLITATFSFSSNHKIGNYYLHVSNQANLYYYQNGGFTLRASPSDNKLLALTPAWASQTDTASLLLTGFNTHFNLTDTIWLENKFGFKIKPFSMTVTTDTSVILKFAFTKNNLPVIYSLNWRNASNYELMLENVFTLTGSLNASSLLDVNPKDIMCYVNFEEKVILSATHTHFLSEADTLLICNNTQGSADKGVIYPSQMKILNDTTISASFYGNHNCGNFDIYVMGKPGKENYILTGKLHATPPVTIREEDKEKAVKIFPNPSDGIFALNVNADFEKGNLAVFDMYGKMILNMDKIEPSLEIDLSEFASGVYFVKLFKGSNYQTEKVIKR